MKEGIADKSWDSEGSSTASEVLIRSTSIHRTPGNLAGAQGSERLGAWSASDTASVGAWHQEGTLERGAAVGRESRAVSAAPFGTMLGDWRSDSTTGWAPEKPEETESPKNNVSCKAGSVISPGGATDSSSAPLGGKVQISLTRLREIPSPYPDFAFRKQDASYIPPALPANKYPAARFTLSDSRSDAVNALEKTKISACKREPSPPKVYVTKHLQNIMDMRKKDETIQNGNKTKDKDIEISQFTTGQKGALLAALNKRAHGGPITKQVRVQLLEDSAAVRRETCSQGSKKKLDELDNVATVAAATAAAIAATAPLLKAQSDMEAQVNSVTQVLNKLTEVDRQLQQLSEQQSKIQSHPQERPCHDDRVRELEKQLARLTEQRLHHLEKLQQQQIQMQSHFINSAMKPGPCQHQSEAPIYAPLPCTLPKHPLPNQLMKSTLSENCRQEDTNISGKSPLETPAPRKFAPVPMAKDVLVPQINPQGMENIGKPTNPVQLGNGVFLQKVLEESKSPLFKSSYKTAVNPTMDYNHTSNDSTSTIIPSYMATRAKYLSQSKNSTANTVVQKADDVLHDLGLLKQEMHGMLREAKQWRPHDDLTARKKASPYYSSNALNKSQSSLLSTKKPPKSLCEDAERILREVQNNKKVLEANLEAIIRAKDGAAMYSLIDTLTTNSNAAENIHIKKSVDIWITEMNSEIQEEISRKDNVKKQPNHKVQESVVGKKSGASKDAKSIKSTVKTTSVRAKPTSGISSRSYHRQNEGNNSKKEEHSHALQKKDAKSRPSQQLDESAQVDEDVLNLVYGKPIYQGHRSTLKKDPYLRFNSPSPKSKPRRPRVLETVKGVKMKSARVQTNTNKYKTTITKLAPKEFEPQYVFSPVREELDISAPLEGHLIPMAIPLGRSQFDGISPMPSSVIIAQPQTTTVNVSIPPSPRKTRAKSVKPNVAVVEMRSEKKDPPQLRVQVLPCVDIDSIASESSSVSQLSPKREATPPPTPTPAAMNPDIQLPLRAETEEEVLAFPGTSFVQVSEITQDEESEAEIPEPLLEVNGCAEMPPTQYNGIPFPPSAPPPAPQASDILEGIISRKETLENRVISWVEQEIMARIISEMQPVRQEAVPDVSQTSTEESGSVASDIVEAAGGQGFQLFVDAGVPVDSDLIRRYVDEALAETIAIMLGEREARNAQKRPLMESDVQIPVEIPLVSTPECTPPASPLPPVREHSTVKTPELSPQTSVAEPIFEDQAAPEMPTSPVATPVITPVASPPRVATPTPLISEEPDDSPGLPGPWGTMDLPLEEENPHSLEESLYKDVVVLTVAKDEEPESLISAASSEPEKSSVSIPPELRSPSPAPTPSSAPSTEESTLTVTATDSDTTDRPISEGEVVYSYEQIAAAQVVAESGVIDQNLTESLSSTLRDAHDMEYDPPSEGQVIYGPRSGAHRDPVLSLLAKFNQDLVAPLDVYYPPECSEEENSMGEISEGQRPRFTNAAEQVLVGHSAFMGRPANVGEIAGHEHRHLSSPGQYDKIPELNPMDSDNVTRGPMSIGDLEVQQVAANYPNPGTSAEMPTVASSSSQVPAVPLKEHQPTHTRLIQVGVKRSDDPPTERAPDPPKKMSVILPSIKEVDHDEDRSTIFLDSESSASSDTL
ncbi:TALPID3 protein isoform X2 [Xenopus laevis]|uniref:TALPID3 protein isoform X2 n=1 Tax=Xenopus laevis TaxID=8355 RepID=A0A8J0TL50_XENLA|nr:TALPID3 protein isoform X2 [Xenopus laevis]